MGGRVSVFLGDDGYEPDAAGLDAFYASTSRTLLGQLYAMCGDLSEAQECLQEAYLRAWQRWPKLAGYDDPAAWVRRVAWRLSVNRWHRARNAVRAWTRRGVPQVAEPSPDRAMLARALRTLPPAQREAIVLHHLMGMTVEQIAEHVGAPTGTVKARLARGRASLATQLSEEGSP